ncbi:hypothetical protein Mal52_51190 [Symmachiella dynata]|uniref:Uncharacterized protein n=1 Tax=Symmachiella dynata TaxID=2527995 RepID=A0A517ZVT7_9PLAN|nr:hypothetical protein [Symmachiella dynata]QDU46597.1 hypothetical protein Mal52_51190 [Symmachiella dynata]
MTTDKPKWWQSWIAYAFVGLILMVGPYVGGYFLLAEDSFVGESVNGNTVIARDFKYDAMRIGFGPLAWGESRLRGVVVRIAVPGGLVDHYFDKSLLKKQIREAPE